MTDYYNYATEHARHIENGMSHKLLAFLKNTMPAIIFVSLIFFIFIGATYMIFKPMLPQEFLNLSEMHSQPVKQLYILFTFFFIWIGSGLSLIIMFLYPIRIFSHMSNKTRRWLIYGFLSGVIFYSFYLIII